MAGKVVKIIKLQFIGGQAKPGPELASAGINMPKFCTEFNAASKERTGEVIPVVITAFADKSFSFILKTTPASRLILKYANLKKASPNPNKEKVGKISLSDVKKIAEYKLVDLNTNNIESAIKIISGTVKSMGIEIIKE